MTDRELNGWKEVAAYLGKAVRTAQRWEQDLGLPIRRIQGPAGEFVTARTDELDQWRNEAATSKTGARELREADSLDKENGTADDGRAVAAGPDAGTADATPDKRQGEHAASDRASRLLVIALLLLAMTAAVGVGRVVWARHSERAAEAVAPARPGSAPTRDPVLDPGPWPTTAHDGRRTNQSHLRGVASPGVPRLIAGSDTTELSLGDIAVTADGQVLFGGCGWLAAASLTGRETWRIALGANGVKHQPSGITLGVTSLAYVTTSECPDVAGSVRTALYEVSFDGRLTRSVAQGATYAGPVVGPDRTVQTVDETALVRAYQPWLEQRWATDLAGYSSHGLAIDSRGNSYVGNDGGRFHQSSLWSMAPDGTIRWRALDGDVGRPAVGADDVVHVADRCGVLWAFAAGGSPLWHTQVGPISSLAPLAIGTSGTVYVKGLDDLVAVAPGGRIAWRYGSGRSQPDHATALLDKDENVYAAFGDRVCSVTRGGRERWCVPIEDPDVIVAGGDGILLVTSKRRKIYLIADAAE